MNCTEVLCVAGGIVVALASFYLAYKVLTWLAGRILTRLSKDMDAEDDRWFPDGGGKAA